MFKGAFAKPDTSAENCLNHYATRGEAKAARDLVNAILSKGYEITVNDGEEITVSRSVNRKEILDALCTTNEDRLIAHSVDNRRIGVFLLIYGNDPVGTELIADHSDNEACNAIADQVQA